MEAGRLRKRVAIQYPEETYDPAFGAISVEWKLLANVWAEVAPLSAREYIAASALDSVVTARITIRYRDDITNENRIVYRDKIYNIQGTLNDIYYYSDYITLPCSQDVTDE